MSLSVETRGGRIVATLLGLGNPPKETLAERLSKLRKLGFHILVLKHQDPDGNIQTGLRISGYKKVFQAYLQAVPPEDSIFGKVTQREDSFFGTIKEVNFFPELLRALERKGRPKKP